MRRGDFARESHSLVASAAECETAFAMADPRPFTLGVVLLILLATGVTLGLRHALRRAPDEARRRSIRTVAWIVAFVLVALGGVAAGLLWLGHALRGAFLTG